MPLFVYIPAEGEKKACWLNLSLASKINEHPDGKLTVYGVTAVPIDVEGQQARHLRAALAGQTRPQLPAIPAAEQLEARLERRGVIQ